MVDYKPGSVIRLLVQRMGRKQARHTAIEDKLKFNKLQIDQIWCDGFVCNPHTNMLNFNHVSSKRIVESILKVYEIRYLGAV